METGTAVITVNQKYDKFYIHQTSTQGDKFVKAAHDINILSMLAKSCKSFL